jgi:acyl dehydratase
MSDGLVHPIALFHAPIQGAGTSIGELFALGGVSGDSGSVGLIGYDWEYLSPLCEDEEYVATGGIVAAQRHTHAEGGVDDVVAFSIELRAGGGAPIARVTNRWRFRRGTVGRSRVSVPPPVPPTIGDATLPPWEMPVVDAARMKTMAALLRDPYPVHWDRLATERLGLGGRVVNQGPLNLGYVANMLMAWAGDAAIRRLSVSFGAPVLDGDRVVAGGVVRNVTEGIARCDVWLRRDDEQVVTGTAEVVAPAGSEHLVP